MPNDISKWRWIDNPFILKIDPKLFTGYKDQVDAVLKHIQNHHKIALITGNTGAGKTTLLSWLKTNMNSHSLYVSKPPQTPDGFISLFTDTFGFTFWERLFRTKPTLYTLPDYANKKLKGQHLVFLLDEAHEANQDVLEWLRVLTDQISMSLIIAALPVFDNKLRDLQTLDQRITTRISLTALSKEETKELLRKRIEEVGGHGIEPFTDESLEIIYRRTGGFPREVLKFCDRLVNTALDKDLDVIDAKDIEKEHREMEVPNVRVDEPVVTFMPRPPSEEQIKNLPYKQRKILETLSKKDWLTPTAITEALEWKTYASKSHAIRSINNILHRLMLDGFVQRESRGKAFMYALTPKVKTMFVQA